jgi:Leucine-rich repeat (LRR) protein
MATTEHSRHGNQQLRANYRIANNRQTRPLACDSAADRLVCTQPVVHLYSRSSSMQYWLNKQRLGTEANIKSGNMKSCAAIVPALLLAVILSSTPAIAAAPYAHIVLNGKKCARGVPPYELDAVLELVECADYGWTNDASLRFVFDGDIIRISAKPTRCVGYSSATDLISVVACDGSYTHYRWILEADPPRIMFHQAAGYMWFAKGSKIKYATNSDENTAFVKIDPPTSAPTVSAEIQLLKLDAHNICAEAPRNAPGDNHVYAGQVSAAECDLNNMNQQFLFYANGAIKVGDGTIANANTDAGWCLDVYAGQTTEGTKLITWECDSSNKNQIFEIDASSMRIRWKYMPSRVIGADNIGATKPLLGFYRHSPHGYTMNWQPSVTESELDYELIKLDGRNVCVETQRRSAGDNHFYGGHFFAADCDLNNVNQRFILYPSGAIKVADGTLSPTGNGWCLDVTGGGASEGTKLQTWTCVFGHHNQVFQVDTISARIRWPHIASRVIGVDNLDVAQPNLGIYTHGADDSTMSWRPTVGESQLKYKLLELDVSNLCAEAQRNSTGDNHVDGGHIFAAKCDLNNLNQRFIFHSNGAIQVGDGTFENVSSNRGWCLDAAGADAKLQMRSCNFGRSDQTFQVDTTSARIRNADRVIGVDSVDAVKPLLGLYTNDAADSTMNWRPSLGNAQVMFKLAVNNTNLCLDTSGGEVKTAACVVDTREKCSRDPVDPAANIAQSFMLKDESNSQSFVFADDSNRCMTNTESALIPMDCEFDQAQQFLISHHDNLIASRADNKVFTLNGAVASGTSMSMSPWNSAKGQKWEMVSARVPKCPQLCSYGPTCPTINSNNEAACGGVCVMGVCESANDTAICCGKESIDTNCLNSMAKSVEGITIGNWCMICTGHGPKGLTGCSTLVSPPGNLVFPSEFTGADGTLTHVRCSYDNRNENKIFPLSVKSEKNENLTYLALTGALAPILTSDLCLPFPNLVHLDLAGSAASGFLFGEKAARTWTQLEHVNVSTTTTLCNDGCFHLTLTEMKSLRVLDMSHMGLDSASALESLRTLTSLQELYLNHNSLKNLPDNFFDNMLELTKLRMRGNPMRTTLPEKIYKRTVKLDSDVNLGVVPADAFTAAPTTETPSATPSLPQPTSMPTTPPSQAPTDTPTMPPTLNPTLMPSVKPSVAPTAGAASSGGSSIGVIIGVVIGLLILVVVGLVAFKRYKNKNGGTAGDDGSAGGVTGGGAGAKNGSKNVDRYETEGEVDPLLGRKPLDVTVF